METGNLLAVDIVLLTVITVLFGAYLFGICKWAWYTRLKEKKVKQPVYVILDLDGKYAGAIQAKGAYQAKQVFDTLDMDGSQFYLEEIQLENDEDIQ